MGQFVSSRRMKTRSQEALRPVFTDSENLSSKDAWKGRKVMFVVLKNEAQIRL
jgi:hypothetical protein